MIIAMSLDLARVTGHPSAGLRGHILDGEYALYQYLPPCISQKVGEMKTRTTLLSHSIVFLCVFCVDSLIALLGRNKGLSNFLIVFKGSCSPLCQILDPRHSRSTLRLFRRIRWFRTQAQLSLRILPHWPCQMKLRADRHVVSRNGEWFLR